MAIKSKSVQVIGKYIVNGVHSRTFSRAVTSGLFAYRNGHTSTYDKNVEEDLQSSKVPDDLIKPNSDKYWSPHPQTGVFGPSSSSSSIHTTNENRGSQENSVMEEKAWFRPTSLEDLDKTHHS